MASLNSYGCSNITSLRLEWDNRQRITGSIWAPPEHRTTEAAATLFYRLQHNCHALTTLYVRLCLEWMRTREPDGRGRRYPFTTYEQIPGRWELKALIQSVRAKEGGKVYVEIGVDDRDRQWEWKQKEKQTFVDWLNDGVPVEDVEMT